MEKIPCIRIDSKLIKYIEPYLIEWGYKESCPITFVEDLPLLVINVNGNFGNFTNIGEYRKYDFNRILVNNPEEFLERAASLMGKTYKRKDMKREFTKEDLKSGMVVKTKNNNMYLVVGNKLITNDGYVLLDSYNKSLENSLLSEYDIIEVYSKVECWGFGFSEGLNLALEYGELIWKRKVFKEYTMQEIADKLGIPVEQLRIKK